MAKKKKTRPKKVHAVIISYDYEGDVLFGVYSTRRRAETAIQRTNNRGDERAVVPFTLDKDEG